VRLTHVKLAGFKSFVDPTTIPTPGKLVGIVGPNGCGKSNVIDAVRWVLGESSAKQLRGESMTDVIFNGSSERKPVSRASVELTFDNSLGRAAGAWSQYAELSVKRVLHRDGESQYFVNNMKVRRKDVTDIFLGTGLGPRAYAIIEQGTISRIIEARPEDMRIFLEEAAGVSKYKERRKETEFRLRDTRENLLRVEDVRQELDKQLSRLESQAVVAQRYHELQKELQTAKQLLLLLKRRDAAALREKHQREVQRLMNELEAETARLRQSESQLEEARNAHYAASDALHAAQAALYEANAEVARQEQGLKHQRDSRERLNNQAGGLRVQQAQQMQRRREAEEQLAHWRQELEAAKERVAESKETLERESQGLPQAEAAFRDRQELFGKLQRELAQAEQAAALEETNLSHARKARQQLEQRIARLEQEREGLPSPDREALESLREELAEVELILEEVRGQLEEAQQRLPQAEESRRQAFHALQQQSQETARLDARLLALQQMQNQLERNQDLQAWLEKHRLDGLPRLWQRAQVEAGWENALESVLRERLNGILVDEGATIGALAEDAPPAMVALAFASEESASLWSGEEGPRFLADMVTWDGRGREAHPAFLREWLRGVRVAPSAVSALAARETLGDGESVVCPEGHLFTRHGVVYYAQQSELHGVLARKREIEELEGELERAAVVLEGLQSALKTAEEEVSRLQADLAVQRSRAGEFQQKHHRLQMELHKQEQQAAHMDRRREQIGQELKELAEQMEIEAEQAAECEYNLESLQSRVEAFQEQLEAAAGEREEAENALARSREAARLAEREFQEAGFYEKTCLNKLGELDHAIQAVGADLETLEARLEDLLLELEAFDEEPAKEGLQLALSQRQEREEALTAAREAMNEAGQRLKQVEEARMRSEQGLNPLRDKLNEGRLKEQEARLTEEQLAEQLRAENADEGTLAGLLEQGRRSAAALQGEIDRLGQDIAALGPVNLAALEELKAERERKTYLDEQAADLNEAIDTLEQAIRRIDRETRDLLQATYDEVNKNLGELFPTLFGGGQARLVLTGEEILDAGIQIVAQPPGKKNSTIHLLSGGEKALTALSLVFSMFRLNPAPFCLLDEVDAPLDDSNTERFCELVKKMAEHTQFLFISHNKITMEMADQLVGITQQERGVSCMVAVDIEEALKMRDAVPA
jgi:chromosome segregation protein